VAYKKTKAILLCPTFENSVVEMNQRMQEEKGVTVRAMSPEF
jgi:hypothetical protein